MPSDVYKSEQVHLLVVCVRNIHELKMVLKGYKDKSIMLLCGVHEDIENEGVGGSRWSKRSVSGRQMGVGASGRTREGEKGTHSHDINTYPPLVYLDCSVHPKLMVIYRFNSVIGTTDGR